MSLLDKAWECLEISRAALEAGDNRASLEWGLKAAQYLQLYRLLRTELDGQEDRSK